MQHKANPLFAIFILILFYNCATEKKTRNISKGSIEISINDNNSGDTINDTTFSVVIKNNTDSIASFYEDWNMWGYDNLIFRIKTSDTIFILYRQGKSWDRNFPSYVTLRHGDSLKIPLPKNFYSDDKHFKWFTKRNFDSAKIIAQYKLHKENHTFNNVWQPFMKRKDSLQAIRIYKSFPLEKFESKEYDCSIKKGVFKNIN